VFCRCIKQSLLEKQAFFMLAAWTGEQWQMGRVALKANLWLYLLQGTCFSPSHWGLTPAMLDQAGRDVATE
jgi:hypothetical protein